MRIFISISILLAFVLIICILASLIYRFFILTKRIKGLGKLICPCYLPNRSAREGIIQKIYDCCYGTSDDVPPGIIVLYLFLCVLAYHLELLFLILMLILILDYLFRVFIDLLVRIIRKTAENNGIYEKGVILDSVKKWGKVMDYKIVDSSNLIFEFENKKKIQAFIGDGLDKVVSVLEENLSVIHSVNKIKGV